MHFELCWKRGRELKKVEATLELYLTASGIGEKDDKIKSATLLHVAGEEALEIYNKFTWDEEGDD